MIWNEIPNIKEVIKAIEAKANWPIYNPYVR